MRRRRTGLDIAGGLCKKRRLNKRRPSIEFEQCRGATLEFHTQSSTPAAARNSFQIDEIDLTGVAVEALNLLRDAIDEVELDFLASISGRAGGINKSIGNHEIPLAAVLGTVERFVGHLEPGEQNVAGESVVFVAKIGDLVHPANPRVFGYRIESRRI